VLFQEMRALVWGAAGGSLCSCVAQKLWDDSFRGPTETPWASPTENPPPCRWWFWCPSPRACSEKAAPSSVQCALAGASFYCTVQYFALPDVDPPSLERNQ